MTVTDIPLRILKSELSSKQFWMKKVTLIPLERITCQNFYRDTKDHESARVKLTQNPLQLI